MHIQHLSVRNVQLQKKCEGLVLDFYNQNEESKEDVYALVHLAEDLVNDSSNYSYDKDGDDDEIQLVYCI